MTGLRTGVGTVTRGRVLFKISEWNLVYMHGDTAEMRISVCGAQWSESMGEVGQTSATLKAYNPIHTTFWGLKSRSIEFLVKFLARGTPKSLKCDESNIKIYSFVKNFMSNAFNWLDPQCGVVNFLSCLYRVHRKGIDPQWVETERRTFEVLLLHKSQCRK